MKWYVIGLVLAAGLLYADEDRPKVDVDMISENSSLALAQSLGDVDIGRAAECIITEQYGILVWQRQYTKYDEWCLAGILDRQGKPEAAAIMRCSDKATKKLYGAHCESILKFASHNPGPPASTTDYVEVEEAEMYRQEVEQKQESVEDRLDRIEAASRAAARASRERKERAQFTIEQLQEKDNDPEDD